MIKTPEEIATKVREWLENLELSDTEGAEALHLTNGNATMREYKNPAHERKPAAPTIALMDMTLGIAAAVVLMRKGKCLDARETLELMLTEAVMRRVRSMSPGLASVRRPPPSMRDVDPC